MLARQFHRQMKRHFPRSHPGVASKGPTHGVKTVSKQVTLVNHVIHSLIS